jgi:hypothetical protein
MTVGSCGGDATLAALASELKALIPFDDRESGRGAIVGLMLAAGATR